jgi:alkylhydroperoxidase family enzyme
MTTRLAPLSPLDPRSADPLLDDLVAFVGYRPNALLTMARKPGLLAAVLGMVGSALRGPGELPLDIRFLAACEASRRSGCFYSTVHSVHAAHHAGIEWAKLAELDRYAVSSRFSHRERAALALAGAGGTLPTGDSGHAFDAAKAHFSEGQILEIVAAVSLFGWFNRWNSLMQSELEDVPAQALHHVPWLAQWRASLESPVA